MEFFGYLYSIIRKKVRERFARCISFRHTKSTTFRKAASRGYAFEPLSSNWSAPREMRKL